MRHLLPALGVILSISQVEGALPSAAEAPLGVLEYVTDPTPDAQGDTPLLRLSRAACLEPKATPLLKPLIVQRLQLGDNPMHENKQGCNALFYLAGIPGFTEQLRADKLLPKEEALKLPQDDASLLSLIHLRANQAALAEAEGSRAYLKKHYCAPLYTRASLLLRHYLASDNLTRVPEEGGVRDCLIVMREGAQEKAYAEIEALPFWRHGEHFLEAVPAELLSTLQALHWPVSPGKLRLALKKLATLLPASQEDMIDCYAAAPMATLLEMLADQQGNAALPDIRKYEKSYDPELVQACLRLQLRLRGITPPDEAEEVPEQQAELRAALLTDAAMHSGATATPDPALLKAAAACLRAQGLPLHAQFIEDMAPAEGETAIAEELMPSLRSRYEALEEPAPRTVLLRRLLEHPEQLKAEAKPAEVRP